MIVRNKVCRTLTVNEELGLALVRASDQNQGRCGLSGALLKAATSLLARLECVPAQVRAAGIT